MMGGNLRFPPIGPPSDTLQLVAGEHGQSPHSRQLEVHEEFGVGT